VFAIFALRHPRNKATAAGSQTSTPSVIAPASSPSSSTGSTGSTPAGSSSAPSTSATSSHRLVGAFPLIVLNNTPTIGLAKQASGQFEAKGWTVSSYADNYHNDIVSTCAYYDPHVARAKAVAMKLQQQFPAIKRVEPRFKQLPSGPIVIVLDAGYPGSSASSSG
jgi:hypothetical protein